MNYSQNPEVQKFFVKHNEDYVRNGSYLIFKDGARIESGAGGFGMTFEPPEDKYERAKLRLYYRKVKCKAAVRAFRDYQETLMGINESLVCIHECTEEDQVAKLRELHEAATEARKKLRKAEQRVAEHEPAWIGAKRRSESESKRRKQQFKNKIEKFKL